MPRRGKKKSKAGKNAAKSANGGQQGIGGAEGAIVPDAAAVASAARPRQPAAAAAATNNPSSTGPSTTTTNSTNVGSRPFVFGAPEGNVKNVKKSSSSAVKRNPATATSSSSSTAPSPVGVDQQQDPPIPPINADAMTIPNLLDGSTTEEDDFSSDEDDTDSEAEDIADTSPPVIAPPDTKEADMSDPKVDDRAAQDKSEGHTSSSATVAEDVETERAAKDTTSAEGSNNKNASNPDSNDSSKPIAPTPGSSASSAASLTNDNEEEDDEDDEEVDDTSHASMPSLIDGAASDPGMESDASDNWIQPTEDGAVADDESGDEEKKSGSPPPIPSTRSAQSMPSASPFGAFPPMASAAQGTNQDSPLFDFQKRMAGSRSTTDTDRDGTAFAASSMFAQPTTWHPAPPQVTDDESEARAAAANSSPPTSKKSTKKKSKKKGKKKKAANKPSCPITTAVRDGQSGPDIERLVLSQGVDVTSFRSKTSGHNLLQVAAMAGKVELLDWLVKERDVDPTYTGSNGRTLDDLASTDAAKKKSRSLTNWYQVKKQREAEERRRLEERTAIRIQAVARVFNARCKLFTLRGETNLGPWSKLLDKVMSYEAEARLNLGQDKLPESFGKSWIQLRKELDIMVQDKELDLLGDTALKLSTTVNDGATDESASPTPNQAALVSDKIQMTADVLRWVRKQDSKKRALFVDRVVKLAAGDRSNCRNEYMKGSKTKVVTAAKLNEKESIICSQRGKDILVWFVCGHESVARCRQLVDLSYERVAENESSMNNDSSNVTASESSAFTPVKAAPDAEPEMLCDPSSNVPLKIHEVEQNELNLFKENANYIPTLKLTEEEESIVLKKKGTVLLLGRSGTGKTLCVCNRMLRDSQLYGSSGTNQLFVARTQRLCKYVRGIFEGAGGNAARVNFLSVANFVQELFENVAAEDDANSALVPVVDFNVFRAEIWNQIKGNEKVLDDLQVWTQIRSFLKGSWDASVEGTLSKEDYLSLPRERCRLSQEKREDAYAIFMRYKIFLEEKGWRDSMDKTSDLIRKAMKTKDFKLYDRIYVDEVQDITQAEIGLLFLATGQQYDGLFLAGDPAQAVSQGVDFRFEEVRSLVYNMSGGQQKVERWEKLYRNFRSHEGILRVSNLVLDCLHNAFPGAALKLPFDHGLTLGPRPGLLQSSFQDLARLVKANERLRILTRDEHKAALCAELAAHAPDAKNAVWGIVEAKGLEFTDCVVVDFFSTLSESALQKSWKNLLLNPQSVSVSSRKGRGSDSALPLAMELELKLFYTGITRACNRLLVIETKPSQAFDAFSRTLQNKELCDIMTPDAVVREGRQIMTADDWRKEAFDMASLAEENEHDAANFLERAIVAMEKANDALLVEKAKLHLSAVQDEMAATVALMKNAGDHDDMAVSSLMSFLEAGLTSEAARACGVLCRKPALKGLARRIKKLGESDILLPLADV